MFRLWAIRTILGFRSQQTILFNVPVTLSIDAFVSRYLQHGIITSCKYWKYIYFDLSTFSPALKRILIKRNHSPFSSSDAMVYRLQINKKKEEKNFVIKYIMKEDSKFNPLINDFQSDWNQRVFCRYFMFCYDELLYVYIRFPHCVIDTNRFLDKFFFRLLLVRNAFQKEVFSV